MLSISRALTAAVLAVSLAVPTMTHAAAKYPTYHINELFLTPYQIKAANSLGDYNTADQGKEFVAIYFHAINRDDVENEVSSDDIKLIAGGQSISQDYADISPALDDTVIEPGAAYAGAIVFQVPLGLHSGALVWAPSAPCCGDIKYPTYRWRLHF
jgi:hypothetical protein